MPSPRLRYALDEIPSSDWEFFERFAAEFLVEEYPGLRTTASNHGDKGRDGEIFEIDGFPTHLVQYSLAADWREKIQQTVRRLRETKPDLKALTYATARRIGADADELKRSLREKDIALDVLDQSYFVERELLSPQRRAASEELIERIVEPLLRERKVVERVAEPLASDDAQIAVLHLALDANDEASDKNLTKACFESLVLAALHDTSAEETRSLDEICETVQTYMPTERAQQVRGQTESALVRLSRKRGPVKRVADTERYHLSFERRQELEGASTEFLLRQNSTESELVGALGGEQDSLDEIGRHEVGTALRRAVESLLLQRGERFAQSLVTGELQAPTADELSDAVSAIPSEVAALISRDATTLAIRSVLANPSDATRSHVQSVADAYTMFAFLRQTPDVQKVADRLFADAEIWLDTSIVLPLLAETAEYEALRRPYTAVLEAAQASGIRFYITAGVIEEVETHIYNSRKYSMGNFGVWHGRIPFLFTAYMTSGLPRSEFSLWVEEFRTDSRPLEDVEEYLDEVFSISRRDLAEIAATAGQDLRGAVQELWAQAHEGRRSSSGTDIDNATMLRLVSHDVENTVGVIMARKETPPSPLGYRHWWLTLDRVAYNLDTTLREALGKAAPHSPAMDPSYLVRVLRVNRARTRISPELRFSMPVLLEFPLRAHKPEELIRIAEEIRLQNAGRTERVIRHAIRDRMDELRTLKRSQPNDGHGHYSNGFDLVAEEM